MIQWHPAFTQLLRPIVETNFDLHAGMPVGDAPRPADLVLLQQTSRGAPPFQGLWRWLTEWNVPEFKGPSVSARVDDLDDLVEVGLGIHRRLNEQRRQEQQPLVGRAGMSWWYLANHLGRRWRRDVTALFGTLQQLEVGVWRVELMARTKMRGPKFDLTYLIQEMGRSEIMDQMGVKEAIDAIGLKRAIDEIGLNELGAIGLDKLLSGLTPKQRQELRRRLQE